METCERESEGLESSALRGTYGKSVKLPYFIYSFMYWLRPSKKYGKIDIVKVCIDGYDIRADKNLRLYLIIHFHDVVTNRHYAFKQSDVYLEQFVYSAEERKRFFESDQGYGSFPLVKGEYVDVF